MSDRFHPATVLISWTLATCYLVMGAEHLSPVTVGVPVAGICLCAATRYWKLLRRMRFLLVAIALTFPLLTPGEIVVPFPWISFEGIAMALRQMTVLVLMAGMVAVLMEFLSTRQLVIALMTVLAPIARLGLNSDRLAVRLGLTIETIADRSDDEHRCKALTAGGQDVYQLPVVPWKPIDSLAISMIVLVGIWSYASVRSAG